MLRQLGSRLAPRLEAAACGASGIHSSAAAAGVGIPERKHALGVGGPYPGRFEGERLQQGCPPALLRPPPGIDGGAGRGAGARAGPLDS